MGTMLAFLVLFALIGAFMRPSILSSYAVTGLATVLAAMLWLSR
jgi:hypothetical protein